MVFKQKYFLPSGQIFGKLTVLEYIPGKHAYKCECFCGSIIEVDSTRLRKGRIVNCGSIRCSIKVDIVNQRFGRLVAVNEFKYRKSGKCNRSYVKVKCDCGIEKFVLTTALLGGDTISCGCYKKQRINEAYGKYRESKGLKPDEYITPLIRLERASAKATGINAKILQRDHYVCVLCKSKNSTENLLQIHHIIPISERLYSHAASENLVTLCSDCHFNKAHLGSTRKLNIDLIPTLQHIANKPLDVLK